ncbi:hypothetical protein QQP08_020593, partial [Theobroma cacao]
SSSDDKVTENGDIMINFIIPNEVSTSLTLLYISDNMRRLLPWFASVQLKVKSSRGMGTDDRT